MAYRFRRKEAVPKAVRRVCRERFDDAIDSLRAGKSAQAIHGVRKDIKKTRAVLRLVRTRIARKRFRRVIRLLREAASYLAAPRDAYIKRQTLEKLATHFKGRLASGGLRRLRHELQRGCHDELRRFAGQKCARIVARKLRRSARVLSRLQVRGGGWKAIGPGVTTAYRAGRRAYRVATDDPSPENLHAWRKHVKNLGYQVRLLRSVWPEQMDTTASELEELGEILGDDHDLAVLRQAVETNHRGHERATLRALIAEQHGELRAAAQALGARFYAEKPSAWSARFSDYWHAWRREAESEG